MSNTLSEIIAHKRTIYQERKRAVPLPMLEARTATMNAPKDFVAALRAVKGKHPLIAEIKRASPSKGRIRDDFEPVPLARAYMNGGAACLSVLTEEKWFEGDDAYVTAVANAVPLPVLRKDFIVDPYQVVEARAIGADAILLIMAALNRYEARDLELIAMDLGLAVLIEVHDEAELEIALRLRSPMIGINNRNLKTLNVDLATTERLAASVPADRLLIAESGLSSREDLDRLSTAGAGAFLVGETLMREEDVALATRTLIGGPPPWG
ncbi:MAG: indole-3-glycerol phosphate synthase TrpC [Pacificimonas sp.]